MQLGCARRRAPKPLQANRRPPTPPQVVLQVTGRSYSACDSIPFHSIGRLRIHPSFLRSAPAQAFMDEVDGRPGHVALQSGHLDTPRDVPKVSLSFSFAPQNPDETRQKPVLSPQKPNFRAFFWRGPAEGRWPHYRWQVEHFPNIRRLSKRRARWLFLDKKPLKHLLSVYTISANAIRP